MNDYWVSVKDGLPPEGQTVDTKIHDETGERNTQQLKRRGRLWFFPDDSMYVYYTPTHWKDAADIDAAQGKGGDAK